MQYDPLVALDIIGRYGVLSRGEAHLPGSCSYDGKEGKLVRLRYREQIQCMEGVSQASSSLADY